MEELQNRVKELCAQVTPETVRRINKRGIVRLNQVIHTGVTMSKANYPDISFTSSE
jgi:hypothetical protein